MQLLSKYTSQNLHRAEQSSPAIPVKENCVTMSHPYKNTLPQHNSVSRCKLFAIQNCTILTYVAPFCTIPDKNYQRILDSNPLTQFFCFSYPHYWQRWQRADFFKHKNNPITNKCNEVVLSGANTRIRTGDLILTKDVLCRLSHISKLLTVINYIILYRLCQGKFANF